MNIEKLARVALGFLKTKETNFPKHGVIAGGSLGNLIWEQVSGNVAVVNDIDIFIFDREVNTENVYGDNTNTTDNKKIFYRSLEKIYYKDYTGLCEGSRTRDFYLIERTENSGLFNYVYYSATSEKPELVIDSFDINCTQVGYDIESDRFFWTKEFEQFLKDGKLKLTNLGSPHHSVIRILKKRDELNASLDPIEIKIAAYTVARPLHGVTRKYFSDKYFTVYEKYQEELSKYFKISKETEISSLIKESKGVDVGIYTLIATVNPSEVFTNGELDDDSRQKIWHCNDFLFYFRNVQNDINQYKVWSKLQPLFTYENYIDCDPKEEDLDMLKRLIENAPGCIKNLQGISISNQINLVNKLFDTFKDDLTIAISLLENKKIDPDIVLDEQTILLLELSVRVEIVNNKYDLGKILGIPTQPGNDLGNGLIDLLF
jgi:hypothetical protein